MCRHSLARRFSAKGGIAIDFCANVWSECADTPWPEDMPLIEEILSLDSRMNDQRIIEWRTNMVGNCPLARTASIQTTRMCVGSGPNPAAL